MFEGLSGWGDESSWGAGLQGTCTDPLTGELQSVDGYMNIALEKTQEFVNGVKRREYGDAFVRGNNGKLIPANPARTTSNEFTVMYISADS